MNRKKTAAQRWTALDKELRAAVPHLFAVLAKEEDFIELRIKSRDDGTCLAILKVHGEDGGPMVCFGSGYGASGALLAINATIQSGHWKVDKPWGGQKK